jgi:hypothetical protein
VRAVAASVVCDHPLHPDTGLCKSQGCPYEEACGSGAFLIRQRLGIGESAVVVHGDVDVVMASLGAGAPAAGAGLLETRVEALATAVRDTAQLLDVEVDELTRFASLIADDGAGDTVQASEDRESCAFQDTVDGGSMHPQLPGDAMGAAAQFPPQAIDSLNDVVGKGVRCMPGSAGAVAQACDVLGLEALPPLCDRTA